MPIEILLIVVLILLVISIVLNISTYLKIEKEKNLILKELSNYTSTISQIVLNIQQIQKGLNNLEDNLDKIKSTFKSSLEGSFLELDNKLTEIKRQTYSNFQHFETLINENKNEFKTEIGKLHKDILINIESKHKSMDEKMIENKKKHEELLKEAEENYKKIQELEKKIEHIIKLLKEPLTEEDLR